MTAALAGEDLDLETRLSALTCQIEIALRRLVEADWWLPRMRHGLERRWIEDFAFVGFQEDGRARALLILHIDWAIHDAESNAGRFLVTFSNAKHPTGETINVNVVSNFFMDIAKRYGLRREVRVGLTDEVEGNPRLLKRAFEELSLYRADPIRWAEGEIAKAFDTDDPELVELHIECTVAYKK